MRAMPLSYDLATVRVLSRTTEEQRREALARAAYNTELVPSSLVYVDLKTDSGVSAITEAQAASLVGVGSAEPHAELAPGASAGHTAVAAAIGDAFGLAHVLPCAMGRAAERVWAHAAVKPGSVVLASVLFPSLRNAIEAQGGRVVDVIGPSAFDHASDEPFKGDVDLGKLERAIAEHGAAGISAICVELAVNGCGGHPVSLGNLRRVAEIARPHGIPVFLDGCRVLENAALVQQREASERGRSIPEIVRSLFDCATGVTMSALKDFCVREGAIFATRERALYDRAFLKWFRDGIQLSSGSLASLALAIPTCVDEGHVAARVAQVHRLADGLRRAGAPVVTPFAGHAVFVRVAELVPSFRAEDHAAEALAGALYVRSGVRVAKGPPLPASFGPTSPLLRVAVPARRYVAEHLDYVVDAFADLVAHRQEVIPLRRTDKDSPPFQPGRFEPAPTGAP